MSDSLVIGGVTYDNVAGFKATDSNDDTLTYIRPDGNINITENGSNIDVLEYATASVSVSGSGTEVVSVVDTTDTAGGTIRTITAVDISDTTATAADVSSGKYFYTAQGVKTVGTNQGGGGGISVDDIATNTAPSGAVTLSTATAIKANALRAKAQMTSLSSTSVTSVESESLRQCNGLSTVSLPNLTSQIPSFTFTDCKNLETADIGKATTIQSNGFSNCNKLTVLVLRRTSLCSLGNVSAFSNTPLQGYSGRSATVYVPQDLLTTYQNASNWSSLSSVTFAKIEGSIYE